MLRTKAALGVIFVLLGAQVATIVPAARAGIRPDEISNNLEIVANGTEAILCKGGKFTNHGGDISFLGDKAIVLCGNDDETIENDGFVIADISDPSDPTEIGRFECVASASDLAVWGDLVFLAVDRNGDSRGLHVGPYDPDDDGDPSTPDPVEDDCSAPAVSYYDQPKAAQIFRGIRIVSIADPASPELVTSIPFGRAGAHTVSVLPGGPSHAGEKAIKSVYVFGSAPSDRTNAVIEVPLDDPAAAKDHVTMVDYSATFGCHDISFFEPRGLAACAGVGSTRHDPSRPMEIDTSRPVAGASLLDIRDDANDREDDGASPASPKLVAYIENPAPTARLHSAGFSWDGETLIFSDENITTTTGSWSCMPENGERLSGGLWFYDISDLTVGPQLRGYQPPHFLPGAGWCTSVNFNVIPLAGGRDVLVGAWYAGGTMVVDFTDPSQPKEIAYFNAAPNDLETGSATRAAYWYDGFIYINNTHGCIAGVLCLGPTRRGLDVLRLEGMEDALPMERFDMGLQECPKAPAGRAPGAFASCTS